MMQKETNDGKKGGLLSGKKHSEGGMPAIITNDGGKSIEVEGGEAIMTAPAVTHDIKHNFDGKKMSNVEILSAINTQSGGVPIYSKGGRFGEPEHFSVFGGGGSVQSEQETITIFNHCFDIARAYELLESGTIPKKIVRVKTYNPTKALIPIDRDVAMKMDIDIDKPSGIYVDNGDFSLLIDGNHRMYKAFMEGKPYLTAYKIEQPEHIKLFYTCEIGNPILQEGGNIGISIEKIDIPSEDVKNFIYAEGVLNAGIFNIDNATAFAKKWLGYTIISKIGSGTQGASYLTDQGVNLKFTFSKKEAEFCNSIVGEKSPYYSDIFNVKQVGDEALYFIEKEYLDEMNEADRNLFRQMLLQDYEANLYERSFVEQLQGTVFCDIAKVKMIQFRERKNSITEYFKQKGLHVNDVLETNIGLKNGDVSCFDCVYKKGGPLYSSNSNKISALEIALKYAKPEEKPEIQNQIKKLK